MLKVSVLIFSLTFISIDLAYANGDGHCSNDCKICESKECKPEKPDKCLTNQCIVCVNQQLTASDGVINQIQQDINIIKQEIAEINVEIGKLGPIMELEGWGRRKILNLIGLIFGTIGAGYLLISQFYFKSAARRKLKDLMDTIEKEGLPFSHSEDFALMWLDIRHYMKGERAPYPSSDYRDVIKHDEKRIFMIGFGLLLISFLCQFIATLL